MKKVIIAIIFNLCIGIAFVSVGLSQEATNPLTTSLEGVIDQNNQATDKVKTFVKSKLLPQCTNAIFVKNIVEQNAQKVSLDEIKKIDVAWIEAEDELPIMREKVNNSIGKEIKAIAKMNPAIIEAFVMDNQGAIAGANNLTSDYWQGDEAKWQSSYNAGKGGAHFGKLKFDKSANAELQQVSLPIIDETGKVIGAVTYGISVDRL